MSYYTHTRMSGLLKVLKGTDTCTWSSVLIRSWSTWTNDTLGRCFFILYTTNWTKKAVFNTLAFGLISKGSNRTLNHCFCWSAFGTIVSHRTYVSIVFLFYGVFLSSNLVTDITSQAWHTLVQFEICSRLTVRNLHWAGWKVLIFIAMNWFRSPSWTVKTFRTFFNFFGSLTWAFTVIASKTKDREALSNFEIIWTAYNLLTWAEVTCWAWILVAITRCFFTKVSSWAYQTVFDTFWNSYFVMALCIDIGALWTRHRLNIDTFRTIMTWRTLVFFSSLNQITNSILKAIIACHTLKAVC